MTNCVLVNGNSTPGSERVERESVSVVKIKGKLVPIEHDEPFEERKSSGRMKQSLPALSQCEPKREDVRIHKKDLVWRVLQQDVCQCTRLHQRQHLRLMQDYHVKLRSQRKCRQ